ncbi:MAG: hypothetical protein LBL26_06905 [Peptococcaceae bacterium]|jgi:hypothetical protein|nr:hypothetical protein [Peptococcaceae bacterium]
MIQKIKNPQLMTSDEAKEKYDDKYYIQIGSLKSKYQDGRKEVYVAYTADSYEELLEEFSNEDAQDNIVSEFGGIHDFTFGILFGVNVPDRLVSFL